MNIVWKNYYYIMSENELAEAWNVQAGTSLCVQLSACGKLWFPRFESRLPKSCSHTLCFQ